jgi:pyridoxine 5-phosphate synthase
MLRLGINVDHIATVRQARRAEVPDPVEAALLAEKAGADGITVHLREDRRHIQERDVTLLRERVTTKLNLEMAVTAAMVSFAEQLRPDEGGLDIVAHGQKIHEAVSRLQDGGIHVSLFVDPDARQIEASKEAAAHAVEIHTGAYCNAASANRERERETIVSAVSLAHRLGLEVHAGHGLDYYNVLPIAQIQQIVELNIGHSIIARAIIYGMEQAVREMKELLIRARGS